jgi:hypothetical protein
MKNIIHAVLFALMVTPCHAWDTRYYKDAWINQCKTISTEEYCLALWNKIPSQQQGMTCKIGPDNNTIDCDKDE